MKYKPILRKTAQLASKCVSYPLAGNLTPRLRQRIEKRLGKEWFDYHDSEFISCFTNVGLYLASASIVSKIIGFDSLSLESDFLMHVGLLAGGFESIMRFNFSALESFRSYDPGRPTGTSSALGKLVSLPLERLV